MTGAPPGVQAKFLDVVAQHSPELSEKLKAHYAELREQRMIEKALRFPERYGTVGKLRKPGV